MFDGSNYFTTTNGDLTLAVLGNPSHTTAEIIDYIRGADVFDEDADSDVDENREVITGDVLHSQPLVVQYVYPNDQAVSMVFFGSNDGMLHAVLDAVDPDINDPSDVVTHYGSEAWAFISPDHLPRLKDVVEGTSHQYFVDSSPQAYIHDVNGNGVLNDNESMEQVSVSFNVQTAPDDNAGNVTVTSNATGYYTRNLSPATYTISVNHTLVENNQTVRFVYEKSLIVGIGDAAKTVNIKLARVEE